VALTAGSGEADGDHDWEAAAALIAVLAAAAVALGVFGVVAVVVVVAGALRFLAALLRTGVDGFAAASPVRPRVAGSRWRSFLL
jgi:hypothetical protein